MKTPLGMRCRHQKTVGQGTVGTHKSEAGVAMLTTLLLLTLLGAATVPLAVLARLQVRIGDYEVKRQKTQALAWSALQVAAADLPAPNAFAYPTDEEGNPSDSWWVTGEDLLSEGSGGFQVQIVDEGGKLPLMRANAGILAALPGMNSAAAAAICDWVDADDDTLPDGAESGDYAEAGYTVRNGRPAGVGELALVAGVTPQMVWGEDKNGNRVVDRGEDSDGDGQLAEGLVDWVSITAPPTQTQQASGLIDINTATVAQLVSGSGNRLPQSQAQTIVSYRQARGQFTSLAQLAGISGLNWDSIRYLVDRLRPIVAPGSDTTRVNLNTALPAVLQALPGMTPELLEEILAQRGQEPLTQLGQLWDLSTFSSSNAALLDWVGLQSGLWRLYISAWPTGGKPVVYAEALVQRSATTVRVLSWRLLS